MNNISDKLDQDNKKKYIKSNDININTIDKKDQIMRNVGNGKYKVSLKKTIINEHGNKVKINYTGRLKNQVSNNQKNISHNKVKKTSSSQDLNNLINKLHINQEDAKIDIKENQGINICDNKKGGIKIIDGTQKLANHIKGATEVVNSVANKNGEKSTAGDDLSNIAIITKRTVGKVGQITNKAISTKLETKSNRKINNGFNSVLSNKGKGLDKDNKLSLSNIEKKLNIISSNEKNSHRFASYKPNMERRMHVKESGSRTTGKINILSENNINSESGNSESKDTTNKKKKLSLNDEKLKFIIKNLTGEQNRNGKLESGLGKLTKNIVKNKVGGWLKTAVMKGIMALLHAAAPFLLVIILLSSLIFLPIMVIMGMKGPAVAVMDADDNSVDRTSPDYVVTKSLEYYSDFIMEVSSYQTDPDNVVTFNGFNSNVYDIVWVYLTLLEGDLSDEDECLIIDTNYEKEILEQSFNELFNMKVETFEKEVKINSNNNENANENEESGEETTETKTCYKVSVNELTYIQWFEINKENLTDSQIDTYESIVELLEDEDYSAFAGNGNLDVSAYESNAKATWDYLKNMGFNDVGAAGMMGNIACESHFNPSAGAGRSHQGIVQWGGGRLTGLNSYAVSVGTPWNVLQTQLDYMAIELRGAYRGVFSAISNANDITYATDYVAAYYEVCPGTLGDWAYSTINGAAYQGLNTRRQFALKYYTSYAGTDSGSGN